MKLLFWGDASDCTSGFGKITKHVCTELTALGWDIEILAVNYRGDPHNEPWPMYAAGANGDQLGLNRINSLIGKIRPDVILFNNDCGNVAKLLNNYPAIPFVAYMPVDGECFEAWTMKTLSKLTLAIWYTKFGMDQAEKLGFTGRSTIIPHGVDLELFKPMNKDDARRRMNLFSVGLRDVFIVGNVNRNTARKRMDLTIKYFSDWIHSRGISDAYLYLHCFDKDREPSGIDIGRYARYLNPDNNRHIILATMAGYDTFSGFPVELMPYLYNVFDVQVSTTLGEGWGLPCMEGMACGIPQIVPAWAALAEWPEDAIKVACHDHIVAVNGVVYGVADREMFIAGLDRQYAAWKADERVDVPDRTKLEQYNWPRIGRMFHESLRRAIASFVPPVMEAKAE